MISAFYFPDFCCLVKVPVPKVEANKLFRLEALRGFAALYVFAGHLIVGRLDIKHGLLSILFRFGQEAVMLFFLLSGFVIYYSYSTGRDQSFTGYFKRRWLRIYPIFILALLLSWFLGGAKINGELGKALIGNLLMLQDFSFGKPGVWVDTFCGNSPLWSLSYEWWFYMMFYPLYNFVAPHRRQWVVIAISLGGLLTGFVCPNQISRFALYFIIWWGGAEMARTYLSGRAITLNSQKACLGALVVFATALLASVACWRESGRALMWGVHPFLEARHFSAALGLMVGGILWARWKWRGFSGLLGWFVWVAPISYGIYVLHFPILMNVGWLPAGLSSGTQIFISITVVLLVAFLAEIYCQPLVKRMFAWRPSTRPVLTSDL